MGRSSPSASGARRGVHSNIYDQYESANPGHFGPLEPDFQQCELEPTSITHANNELLEDIKTTSPGQRVTEFLWRAGAFLLETLISTAEAKAPLEDELAAVKTGLETYGKWTWTDTEGRTWVGTNKLAPFDKCQTITIESTKALQDQSSKSKVKVETISLPITTDGDYQLNELKVSDPEWNKNFSTYDLHLQSGQNATTLHVSNEKAAREIKENLEGIVGFCEALIRESGN